MTFSHRIETRHLIWPSKATRFGADFYFCLIYRNFQCYVKIDIKKIQLLKNSPLQKFSLKLPGNQIEAAMTSPHTQPITLRNADHVTSQLKSQE